MIGHRVPQKLPLPGSVHGALVAVHSQAQFAFQKVRHRRHDPVACALAFDVDVHVVGVAAELMPSAFEFFIEIIQQDIR